jgi:hypothetical protein
VRPMKPLRKVAFQRVTSIDSELPVGIQEFESRNTIAWSLGIYLTLFRTICTKLYKENGGREIKTLPLAVYADL